MILKGNTRDRRSRTWRRSRRAIIREWPRTAADARTQDIRLEDGHVVFYLHVKLGNMSRIKMRTPAVQP